MASTTKGSDREALLSGLIDRTHALQEDEHEKTSALVRDARVVIRKLFGEASPYLPELDSISFHPKGGIWNKGNYRNTDAWNAGVKQLDHILESMLLECRLPNSSDLNPPKKVTLPWLFKHLSWQVWCSIVAALVAAFAGGVRMGQTTFIRELYGYAPAMPQRDLPTSQIHITTNSSTEEVLRIPPAMPQRDLTNSQSKTATNTIGVLIPPTWLTTTAGITSPDGGVYLGVERITPNEGIPWLVSVIFTAEAPDMHEAKWSGDINLQFTHRQFVEIVGKRYSLTVLQCESNRVQMSVHTLP